MAIACLLTLLICSLAVMSTQVLGGIYVNITILESAVARGAVCLDGSAPAYLYLEGFGNGVRNWIIYMEGGGWCGSKQDCINRSKTKLGSSHLMDKQTYFGGSLDTDCQFNPDFCDWHKLYIHYCDGSSFMSDIENIDPENNLTFRGARIFDVMMEEMLAKGMGKAENAILTGTSAGGLATILHCDIFQVLLPNTCRVKCVSDSSFFIHGKDHPRFKTSEERFVDVVETHGIKELANSLPTSCTSTRNPDLCLFPEYLVDDIQTPLFILESAFDMFQITNNLIPDVGGEWQNCITTNFTLCNATQLQILKDFRSTFIGTLMNLKNCWSRGMFVHSCYLHGHIFGRVGWTCSSVDGIVLANKTIGQAIGDWYFDRSPFHEIDTHNDSPRNCSNNLCVGECFNQKCLANLHHNDQ